MSEFQKQNAYQNDEVKVVEGRTLVAAYGGRFETPTGYLNLLGADIASLGEGTKKLRIRLYGGRAAPPSIYFSRGEEEALERVINDNLECLETVELERAWMLGDLSAVRRILGEK